MLPDRIANLFRTPYKENNLRDYHMILQYCDTATKRFVWIKPWSKHKIGWLIRYLWRRNYIVKFDQLWLIGQIVNFKPTENEVLTTTAIILLTQTLFYFKICSKLHHLQPTAIKFKFEFKATQSLLLDLNSLQIRFRHTLIHYSKCLSRETPSFD